MKDVQYCMESIMQQIYKFTLRKSCTNFTERCTKYPMEAHMVDYVNSINHIQVLVEILTHSVTYPIIHNVSLITKMSCLSLTLKSHLNFVECSKKPQ